MRYLSTGFAIGSLRRGRSIEQFLGGHEVNGLSGVRWIDIWPISNGYKVAVHEVMDIDEIADMYEFPPRVKHDEEYLGQIVGTVDGELEAMALAARYRAETIGGSTTVSPGTNTTTSSRRGAEPTGQMVVSRRLIHTINMPRAARRRVSDSAEDSTSDQGSWDKNSSIAVPMVPSALV
jgi:hypothetical protein